MFVYNYIIQFVVPNFFHLINTFKCQLYIVEFAFGQIAPICTCVQKKTVSKCTIYGKY